MLRPVLRDSTMAIQKLCGLPPFCIDGYDMEEMVYNLAMEGKLGEKARLAAAQIGADC